MTHLGWRSLVALILAGWVLAGCSSQQQEPEPIPPEPVDTRPVDTTPIPEPEPEPRDFGPGLVPLDASGRPLETKFYFEFDQARLSPRDLRMLEMHAAILNRNRDRRVVIEGHCDERGTREYNLALGERRSEAVNSFLTSAGVRGSQIETVSYGEEQPADPGHDESAWRLNRRAVMRYR